MISETRSCQNCRNNFTIEPDDFGFYEKIKVPPPTWCPECRMRRRLVQMNERAFYKRKCDLCGKEAISIFSQEYSKPVYCNSCWWGDGWDPMSYGKEYDPKRSFWEQLKELFDSFPKSARETIESTMVNSDYCNIGSYLKNCYLLFNSDYSEDCLYSADLERSKMCGDIYMGDLSERCFDCSNIFKDNNVRYSSNCNESINVFFSKNLIGCSNCFGCFNLRNKSYYIFNRPYSKEDYSEEIKRYDLGSWKVVSDLIKKRNEINLKFPKRYVEGLRNENFSGDYVFNSKNTFNSYEVGYCEDCKYCQFLFLFPTKDSYDYTMWGGNANHTYECMGTGGGQDHVKFSYECWADNVRNLEYCWYILTANSDLFGCIGLRNKQYCILNKQYTKEDYEKLTEKIKKNMDEMPYVDNKGRVFKYGEFFPVEFSPFGYNETLAQEYFPRTKKEVSGEGFAWKDLDPKNYKVTIREEELPDHIKDVSNDLLRETIECAHKGNCNQQCTTAFRLVPQELEYYREMNIPLPRLCPNCRHYERIGKRDPINLWEKRCDCDGRNSKNGIYKNQQIHSHGEGLCAEKFKTAYSPERPEIVYCESCYNKEII